MVVEIIFNNRHIYILNINKRWGSKFRFLRLLGLCINPALGAPSITYQPILIVPGSVLHEIVVNPGVQPVSLTATLNFLTSLRKHGLARDDEPGDLPFHFNFQPSSSATQSLHYLQVKCNERTNTHTYVNNKLFCYQVHQNGLMVTR